MLFHTLDNGPDRVAPFSHAVSIGPWPFITGQMPTDPKDNAPSTACTGEFIAGINRWDREVVAARPRSRSGWSITTPA